MLELILCTLYSLSFSVPIAFFTGILYLLFGSFLLRILDEWSDVRSGAVGFSILTFCFFMAILTFLISFAYFCRSF